jgi:hypothetical protein
VIRGDGLLQSGHSFPTFDRTACGPSRGERQVCTDQRPVATCLVRLCDSQDAATSGHGHDSRIAGIFIQSEMTAGMRFFFSGEIDTKVGDAYRDVRKEVEGTLNATLGNVDYGDSLVKISIVPMILGPVFSEGRKERRLINHADRVADYRMFIDFEDFLAGSRETRTRLLVDNVLTAVDDIDRKLKGKFDGQRMREDILRLFSRS